MLELTPIEDPSLQSGTAAALGTAAATTDEVLVDENGNPIQQITTCHHNLEFFSRPDYLTTLQSEVLLYFQNGATTIPVPSADASEEVKNAINSVLAALSQAATQQQQPAVPGAQAQ